MSDVNRSSRAILLVSAVGACLALAAPAWAQDADSAFKINGFTSIIGGKVFGGSLGDDYTGPTEITGISCPCYVADWSNGGLYNRSFSLRPESRVGIQASYVISPQFKLAAQLVSRGSDPSPNVQWAYATFAPNKNWEVQVGRKRIPLYFYSDFQDIGVSYPWVSPPPELYGWEVTNYDGASVRYRGNVGDTNFKTSVFFGKEHVKDSHYQNLYYSGISDVTWNRLIGADLELVRGPLTFRTVYMQADVHFVNVDNEVDDASKLKAFGFAANLDIDNWLVLSELTQLTRTFGDAGYKVTAPAFTVGVGYHLGPWTPFINYASYWEYTNDSDQYEPGVFRRTSLTLRYDIGATSAVKAQIDRNIDVTKNFGGDATVLRLSYDRLF